MSMLPYGNSPVSIYRSAKNFGFRGPTGPTGWRRGQPDAPGDPNPRHLAEAGSRKSSPPRTVQGIRPEPVSA